MPKNPRFPGLMMTLIFSLTLGCSGGNSSFSSPSAPQANPFHLSLEDAGEKDRFAPNSNCQTSSGTWQNFSIGDMNDGVVVEYQAMPSADSIDGLFFLSLGPSDTWNDMAATVRFNQNGFLDVRNGSSYQADASIPYLANQRYDFRLEVNIDAHTYSVLVKSRGTNGPVVLAKDYSFRTEQQNIQSLDQWGIQSGVGSFTVCNVAITPRGDNSPDNQPPVADAGSDQTIDDIDDNGSEVVTLDGSPSYDPDGQIILYKWFEASQLLATGKVVQVTLPVGYHTITLEVTDDQRAKGIDTTTVHIQEPGGGDQFAKCGGLPLPHNSGVDPNLPLVDHYGSITVTQPGTVISGLHVHGGITVKADDVVIEHNEIDGGDPINGSLYGVHLPWDVYKRGLIIRHNTIHNISSAGIFTNGVGSKAGDAAYIFKNYIYDIGADGMKLENNSKAECNYIEKLGMRPEAHADVNQTRAGSNIAFNYNNCNIPIPGAPDYPGAPYKSNACNIIQTEVWSIDNVEIVGNRLSGGNYTTYLRAKAHGPVTNVTFADNIITNRYAYGNFSVSDWSEVNFYNNRCEEDGNILQMGQSCLCNFQDCPWHK